MSQQATVTYLLFFFPPLSLLFFPFRAPPPLGCCQLPAPLGLTCVLLTFRETVFSPDGANSARHERQTRLEEELSPPRLAAPLAAPVRGCFAPPQPAWHSDKSQPSLLFTSRALNTEMQLETHFKSPNFLKMIFFLPELLKLILSTYRHIAKYSMDISENGILALN